MNGLKCSADKLSQRGLGLIVLPIVIFFAFIANIALPVLGFFFTIPLLILAGFFLMAPNSEACRLLPD